MMAVFMQIKLPVTTEQYDALNARMQKEGPEFFTGCLAHIAVAESGGGVTVTDLWESREALEAFQERMMPIAAELDLPRPENPPTTAEAHNYWVPGT
ncbi:MAG TPA: hypothetical protein VLH10_23110 [Yinghuangia sp.]|nr:hypothetical protein [Yinghuangia sp.]